MSDELDPTPASTPQDQNNAQPLVDPASAVAAFMEWLQSRDEPAGPFSAHYNAQSGNALVDKFCAAQGWIAVFLDDEQVAQVKSLREKYPE